MSEPVGYLKLATKETQLYYESGSWPSVIEYELTHRLREFLTKISASGQRRIAWQFRQGGGPVRGAGVPQHRHALQCGKGSVPSPSFVIFRIYIHTVPTVVKWKRCDL